ncbi:hypothetical protein [Tessaracoccus sp. G1721]
MTTTFGATTPVTAAPTREAAGDGSLVTLQGRRFHRISGYDRMDPFFMTIVSSSDVWIFISSTGGLTAGRVDAEKALFPYYTDDKVAQSAGRTGGLTRMRVTSEGGAVSHWHPFAELRPGDPSVERVLYKDVLGAALVFEETRPDLGMRFRVTWESSARYGVVRSCELTSLDGRASEVDVLDGLVNILPAGTSQQVQNELSNLLDAYKRSELDPATGLGIYHLNASLTDLAEPSESLRANVAWQVGLDDATRLLSTRQLTGFPGAVDEELEMRGEQGAYLLRAAVTLPPGGRRSWRIVADVDHDAADVVALNAELRQGGIAAALDADLARTRDDLSAILASTDAAQVTGEEVAATHHLANVLYNTMRGGLPASGYEVGADDVRAFVAQRSPATAARCADTLASLPERLRIDALVAAADRSGDPDLWRLAMEYLPLTFSRRHGDPSRPWNRFRIELIDGQGNPRLTYQGNWRDIFQNWEALAWSFPEYVESMITVFLDATTADGYNPYRISREGVDWEVPEPENPWANIGYWSDHQVIYLLKLLETSQRFHPGRLRRLAGRAVFTHADVPYRIATYEATLADPFDTIAFDDARQSLVERRVAREGADGRLLHDPDGGIVRVSLAEKLLLILLAKLVNFVPGGGIWMNTQRPEWNDANNALVGRGLSVVTLAYLRRYIPVVRGLLDADVELTPALSDLLAEVLAVLARPAGDAVDDESRRAVMDALGAAGTAYRRRVYAGVGPERVTVRVDEVAALLDHAQAHIDAALRANTRADAMIHSYNILDLAPGRAAVRRLPEMLEGQVAALSSGALSPEESVALLASLRSSALYRADQHSYILYPDKQVPSFLGRNTITATQAESCPLVGALVAAGDRSVVVRDIHGEYHFAAGIRNAKEVERALDALAGHPDLGTALAEGRHRLMEVHEEVFRHAEFTGRSGSFFAFEGLGSIYWHMVSKLLLAVQETLERAVADGADEPVVDALKAAYEDVRQGLGYCKTPEVYGAFPTDPYSHTPKDHGARQPGMTGQVKEEILTRLGELGVRVEEGRIVVRPLLLRDAEWTTEPAEFSYLDAGGEQRTLGLPPGSLAFTFCQVPVVCVRGGDTTSITAELADGSTREHPDGALSAELSGSVFRREGTVTALRVRIPAGA